MENPPDPNADRRVLGIANQLSLFRLCVTPIFIVVFILGGTTGYAIALAIAILTEITDALDGYLARAKKETSDFGKLVDPMADTVAHFSVFLCFLWGGYAHLWVVALIFYRELLVAYIRIAAARSGFVLAARLSGKLKALTQGVAILATLVLILRTPQNDPLAVEVTKVTAQHLMVLVAAVTLWSGVDYVRTGFPLLRSLLRRKT